MKKLGMGLAGIVIGIMLVRQQVSFIGICSFSISQLADDKTTPLYLAAYKVIAIYSGAQAIATLTTAVALFAEFCGSSAARVLIAVAFPLLILLSVVHIAANEGVIRIENQVVQEFSDASVMNAYLSLAFPPVIFLLMRFRSSKHQ